MATALHHSSRPTFTHYVQRTFPPLVVNHAAPIALALVLLYVLWWDDTPQVATVDDAIRHASWVGVVSLVYVALQARAAVAQARSGAAQALIKILVSTSPLFVVGYAVFDWLRWNNELDVFQVIVMVATMLAMLIDLVIITWTSLRLSKLSTHTQGTDLEPGTPSRDC